MCIESRVESRLRSFRIDCVYHSHLNNMVNGMGLCTCCAQQLIHTSDLLLAREHAS